MLALKPGLAADWPLPEPWTGIPEAGFRDGFCNRVTEEKRGEIRFEESRLSWTTNNREIDIKPARAGA
jgi:hypothetical protein